MCIYLEKNDSLRLRVWADPECNSILLYEDVFETSEVVDEYKQCLVDEEDEDAWLYVHCNSK